MFTTLLLFWRANYDLYPTALVCVWDTPLAIWINLLLPIWLLLLMITESSSPRPINKRVWINVRPAASHVTVHALSFSICWLYIQVYNTYTSRVYQYTLLVYVLYAAHYTYTTYNTYTSRVLAGNPQWTNINMTSLSNNSVTCSCDKSREPASRCPKL